MYSLPSEPGSIGHTLDSGFRLYFVCFKRAVLLSFVAALALFVPTLVLQLIGSSEAPLSGGALALLIPAIVVCLIVYLLFYLSVLYRVGSIAWGRADSAGECLLAGLRRLLPVVFASLLYLLAMMGGMVLLVIPGIILSVSMAFYMLCILFDGDGVLESLRHSHRLVWGSWWRTVVLTSVIMVVYMVIYLAIGVPVAILDELVFDVQFGEQGMFALLGDLLASAITIPMMASVFIVVFHDLKLRKEGHDLEARVEALTAST